MDVLLIPVIAPFLLVFVTCIVGINEFQPPQCYASSICKALLYE